MPALKSLKRAARSVRPFGARFIVVSASLSSFATFDASVWGQELPVVATEAVPGEGTVIVAPATALDVPPYARDLRPYGECQTCPAPIIPSPGAYATPVGPRGCDLPPCAIAAPPGTYVRGWQAAMTEAACREAFVIRRHEWFDGGPELGPEGRRHIARVGVALIDRPELVVLDAAKPEVALGETIDQAIRRANDLDSLRRTEVVRRLNDLGIADADARVVVASVETVGIRGIEAPIIYGRLIQGSFSNGRGGSGAIGIGGGGDSGSGFRGGGFGGGGIGY